MRETTARETRGLQLLELLGDEEGEFEALHVVEARVAQALAAHKGTVVSLAIETN